MKFCDNPLCLFHLDAEPGQTQLTYQVGPKALVVKRLRIVQGPVPGEAPREWNFCELCSNVLAMTSGRRKSS